MEKKSKTQSVKIPDPHGNIAKYLGIEWDGREGASLNVTLNGTDEAIADFVAHYTLIAQGQAGNPHLN